MVMLTFVVFWPEDGVILVTVGAAWLTFTHNCDDIPLPPQLVAVRFTLQFPALKLSWAFCDVLNSVHVVDVRLFRAHFQLVGVLEEVSVKCIVNGATPAQPCEVVFVAIEMFEELKLALGALNLNSTRTPRFVAVNVNACDKSRYEIPAYPPPVQSPPVIRTSGLVVLVVCGD